MIAPAVLYVDNHLLAVDKPAGLPVVPDATRDESLLDRAREWVRVEFEKPGRAWLGVVHRLDRPVSGVVLLARTSKAAARLTRDFREQRAAKVYWGVVRGRPKARAGELEQWLFKDPVANRVRVVEKPCAGAKLARTRWEWLEESAGQSLLEFRPASGRPHQLRVAAASLGHPLLGDIKYGAEVPLGDRSVALHARSLSVDHPTRPERVRFEAPPPDTAVWSFPTCRRARR